jgi:hypothetical protein
MGVKTALAGITLTDDDIAQAETLGIDAKGILVGAQAGCDDIIAKLNVLVNDVMTPASDSDNATTLGTEITALS